MWKLGFPQCFVFADPYSVESEFTCGITWCFVLVLCYTSMCFFFLSTEFPFWGLIKYYCTDQQTKKRIRAKNPSLYLCFWLCLGEGGMACANRFLFTSLSGNCCCVTDHGWPCLPSCPGQWCHTVWQSCPSSVRSRWPSLRRSPCTTALTRMSCAATTSLLLPRWSTTPWRKARAVSRAPAWLPWMLLARTLVSYWVWVWAVGAASKNAGKLLGVGLGCGCCQQECW